jgi:dUTPase
MMHEEGRKKEMKVIMKNKRKETLRINRMMRRMMKMKMMRVVKMKKEKTINQNQRRRILLPEWVNMNERNL